ncbi:hypothetical protein ACOMHN_018922 [Nucella lapillus]
MSINGVVLFSFAFLATLAYGAGLMLSGGSGSPGTGNPGFLLQVMTALQRPPATPACTLSEAVAGTCKAGRTTTQTCPRACRDGECCLLKPGESKASCQPTLTSGSSCSWQHCTFKASNQPSPTQAVYGNVCHCRQMCCLRIRGGNGTPFQGVCSFL